MLKDITIGQYFTGRSVIHRMDARIKILLTIALIVGIFIGKSYYTLGVSILATLIIIFLSGVPFKMYLKSLKPILPIVIFTAVLNLFYVDGDTVLIKFWIIKITTEGINTAVFMSVRILLLIMGASVLTYTTSPTDLTDGIERLLSPLKLFKLDVHSLAMMMTIALRFIPTLIEETDKIMNAQKARGADMDGGSFMKRIQALLPVLIPLFVSSFRRAYELAYAMECRCYNGGEGRTRMKVLKIGINDIFAVLFFAVYFAALIFVKLKF